MTAIGIDFGTSNCSAHVALKDGKVIAVPLEGDDLLLPSVIFTARREIAARQIEANEFSRRLKSERRADQVRIKRHGGIAIDENSLRKSIENAMRRESTVEAEKKYWDQTFFSMLRDGQAILFGTPAFRAYMSDPSSGALVKSPKSFLGSNLDKTHISTFQDVVSNMLSHIKKKAEMHIQSEISCAVVGRPVNYHGTQGVQGNSQAITIMENAAIAAGFSDVHFFMEPVAAALEYEKSVSQETLVLVVDIGGGTTDCAIVRIGTNRSQKYNRNQDVLGYSGGRVGGTDFDQSLAWNYFMPLLGMGTLSKWGHRLPNSIFYDAISTRDVPAQLRFMNSKHEISTLIDEAANPQSISRFLVLYQKELQHRLIHSAELTKIKLSEIEKCTVPLSYLEDGLSAEVSLCNFAEATERLIKKIEKLMTEAILSAGTAPDRVFITGGMGMSPVVQRMVRNFFGDNTPVEHGDMLGSVGKGLGMCANQMLN